MGATETIDASAASRHTGDIDANVTITITGLSATNNAIQLELTEDGGSHTITWSGAVNDVETHSDTDGDVSIFVVTFTDDGPFVAFVGSYTP
jgi:hypothetical protein